MPDSINDPNLALSTVASVLRSGAPTPEVSPGVVSATPVVAAPAVAAPAVAAPVVAAPVVTAPVVAAPVSAKPVDANAALARFSNADPAKDSSFDMVLPPISASEIPEDLPVVPGNTDPDAAQKQNHAFAALRHKLKEYEEWQAKASPIVDKAREVSTASAGEVNTLQEELDQAKKNNSEYQDKLGRLSLSESPEFKAKYDMKISELENKLAKNISNYLPVEGAEAAAEAQKLLRMDPSDLMQHLEDINNPTLAGIVQLMSSEIATVQEARSLELNDWEQSSASMRMQLAREEIIQHSSQREGFATGAIQAAIRAGNPVYGATDPEAKAEADQLANAFIGFAKSADEESMIKAAAEGMTVPYLQALIEEQEGVIQQLNNRVDSGRRISRPPLSSAPPATPPAPPPAVTQPANVAVLAEASDSPQSFIHGVLGDLLRPQSG